MSELVDDIIHESRRSARRLREIIESWREDGLLACSDEESDILEMQCITRSDEKPSP